MVSGFLRERKEVIDVDEACYCGRTGGLEEREPVLDASNRWALRCPSCGQLDYLPWLSEEAGLLSWGKAKHRQIVGYQDPDRRGPS